MSNQFTPGPWTVDDWGHCLAIVTDMHAIVTDSDCHPNYETGVGEQKRANAALISAAPDLYKALTDLLDELDGQGLETSTNFYLEAARKAIAKATTF